MSHADDLSGSFGLPLFRGLKQRDLQGRKSILFSSRAIFLDFFKVHLRGQTAPRKMLKNECPAISPLLNAPQQREWSHSKEQLISSSRACLLLTVIASTLFQDADLISNLRFFSAERNVATDLIRSRFHS